jgi:microcin C transport system permease protein
VFLLVLFSWTSLVGVVRAEFLRARNLEYVRAARALGELTLQAKQNLQAPWLAFTAFGTFAVMLSLLVFIFEGIRDAFDPRKTFQ